MNKGAAINDGSNRKWGLDVVIVLLWGGLMALIFDKIDLKYNRVGVEPLYHVRDSNPWGPYAKVTGACEK